MNIDFKIKSSGNDEWYTPDVAVYPIVKYLKPKSKIWCPFDLDYSEFVRVLRNNDFHVINTHIDTGTDFLNCDVPECDYIVSNPPYSIRNDILIRLFELNKPFAMLMNSNGLFDSKVRWELFKSNQFSLIYLSKRVNYNSITTSTKKTSPNFQSCYICHDITDKQIVFETLK